MVNADDDQYIYASSAASLIQGYFHANGIYAYVLDTATGTASVCPINADEYEYMSSSHFPTCGGVVTIIDRDHIYHHSPVAASCIWGASSSSVDAGRHLIMMMTQMTINIMSSRHGRVTRVKHWCTIKYSKAYIMAINMP